MRCGSVLKRRVMRGFQSLAFLFIFLVAFAVQGFAKEVLWYDLKVKLVSSSCEKNLNPIRQIQEVLKCSTIGSDISCKFKDQPDVVLSGRMKDGALEFGSSKSIQNLITQSPSVSGHQIAILGQGTGQKGEYTLEIEDEISWRVGWWGSKSCRVFWRGIFSNQSFQPKQPEAPIIVQTIQDHQDILLTWTHPNQGDESLAYQIVFSTSQSSPNPFLQNKDQVIQTSQNDYSYRIPESWSKQRDLYVWIRALDERSLKPALLALEE